MPGVCGAYYAHRLKNMPTNGDHDVQNCSLGKCQAQKQQQEALHQTSCDRQNCKLLGTGRESLQITQYIKAGKTPLLRFANGEINVQAYDLRKEDVSFGAVSHGWGDRIFDSTKDSGGNNTCQINQCQIQSLQKSFNELIGKSTAKNRRDENTFFWVDLLCFPKRDSMTAKAMDQLKTVFKKAKAVIVWDRNLLSTHKKQPEDTIEMNVRMRLGGWSRRLRTLQEAVLAKKKKKKIYFEFQNRKFLSLDEINGAREKAEQDSSDPFHHI
ncbi:uncharacterized protein A1O5_10415 [Cladophialophora psammophila CBS 110553]|uniref:Heterokaryon incompatibility domain-containing protein n=1 Tax=Cladophialophora psammophila CBS 110553 TaxID=1182543 RepID=W9WE79_9EURO|nr:uncharacterized protein A1O5_10415 [Cladophialophora psammophila CBS 110553]EXJ66263.1 hypothetical protein A1O5_10415 [Cladophialophora psammophila CBS 110553]